MILLSLLIAAVGLAAMGLSQTGHYQWAFGAPPRRVAASPTPLPAREGLGVGCERSKLLPAAGETEKLGHRARPFLTHPSPLPFREGNKKGLTPARVKLLRWSGLALAGLSLVPAMLTWGPAFGAVGWCGLLSLAAGALLLARTYLTPPAWLRSRASPNNDRHPRAGGDPG